jgi:hypothetical protein
MLKIALTTASGIMLAAFNFFMITVALLGQVNLQIIFLAGWFAIIAIGMCLRCKSLIYIAQTIVSLLLIWRLLQYYDMGLNEQDGANPYTFIYTMLTIGAGYMLAWCVARTIPAKNV